MANETSESTRCWDSLALGWAAWESLGMTPASLQPFGHQIRPPVLVVGAGQGLLVEHISKQGIEVVGMDGSPVMIAEAWRRRGIRIIHGWAHALPFESNSFRTVIITTGVMPLDTPDAMTSIMAEAKRVSGLGALLVAGFFCPSESAQRTGETLGYLVRGRLYQQRIFEIWAASRQSSMSDRDHRIRAAWANRVANWIHIEQDRARDLVVGHSDVLAAIRDVVESMAAHIRQRGHDPEPVLRAGLHFHLDAMTRSQAISLLAAHGVDAYGGWVEPNVSTLTVAGRLQREGARVGSAARFEDDG